LKKMNKMVLRPPTQLESFERKSLSLMALIIL
jgi:hypothetical protein